MFTADDLKASRVVEYVKFDHIFRYDACFGYRVLGYKFLNFDVPHEVLCRLEDVLRELSTNIETILSELDV